MLFCQGLAGSIFVVGWSYRLAQRSALRFWFSHAARPGDSGDFNAFVAAQPLTEGHVHWPNWFLGQNFARAVRAGAESGSLTSTLKVLRALLNSLGLNLWIGLRAIANTWVLTLPAALLWWFGWYDGWNNSFNKGYEQAAVGPLVSLLGIAWFIAAMFYVPLAQARQAVTGQWRAFYQFRLIWKLARERWLSCLMLALLYCLLSIPLAILKTTPMFWMRNSPALAGLTNAQVTAELKGYFFWCALIAFPAFVLVRVVAARIYASGLLVLVRRGEIAESELGPFEREALCRLDLLSAAVQPERHRFVRMVAWAGSRLGRTVGAVLLVLLWFSFVAQIYISQFLNYHGGIAWMNQSLVQLPWFRYLPSSVHKPMADVASVLMLVLVAWLLGSVARVAQRVIDRHQQAKASDVSRPA